jgi:hypothetical protein
MGPTKAIVRDQTLYDADDGKMHQGRICQSPGN